MLKNSKGVILSVISVMTIGLVLMPMIAGCSASNKVLTDKDNGASISLKVNDTFQIKLESNTTTGYSWSPARDTNFEVLAVASSEYVQPLKNKNMVGSGGYEIFTFKVIENGQTDLVLEYQRPWEDGVEPAKTFKISITIK